MRDEQEGVKYVSVPKLRELLLQCGDDEFVMVNKVGNLRLHRGNSYEITGAINFSSEEVERY